MVLRKVKICSRGVIERKQDTLTVQLKQDFKFHLEQHLSSEHIFSQMDRSLKWRADMEWSMDATLNTQFGQPYPEMPQYLLLNSQQFNSHW